MSKGIAVALGIIGLAIFIRFLPLIVLGIIILALTWKPEEK